MHISRRTLGPVQRRFYGQSAVELAILLPLLVIFLLAAGDFGRALTAYIQVGSVAREAAAFGMQSTTDSNDTGEMQAAGLAESASIWGVTPQFSFPGCPDPFSRPATSNLADPGYDCVAVTVTYDFAPLFPFGPIPDTIQMQRTVQMRVVNG